MLRRRHVLEFFEQRHGLDLECGVARASVEMVTLELDVEPRREDCEESFADTMAGRDQLRKEWRARL